MAEYIEREALLEALKEFRLNETMSKHLTREDCETARNAIERAQMAIECIPAADVAPVRHGKWERIGTAGKNLPLYPCCSVCGIVSAAYRTQWEGLQGEWKFCPYCGARMDGERKENGND